LKLGVVLSQLGGPDSPESIEPFLYNLDEAYLDAVVETIGTALAGADAASSISSSAPTACRWR
jgi:hypothetical protein